MHSIYVKNEIACIHIYGTSKLHLLKEIVKRKYNPKANYYNPSWRIQSLYERPAIKKIHSDQTTSKNKHKETIIEPYYRL